MSRTAVSLADLLQAFATLPEGQWDAAADAAGYERKIEEKLPEREEPKAQPKAPPKGRRPKAKAQTQVALPQQRFWRITEDLPNPNAQTTRPAWIDEPLEVRREDFEAAPELLMPTPAPLVRPQQMATFLRRQLARKQPVSELDIPKIVQRIAKRQPLTRLPMREKPRWPARVNVVYDGSATLAPARNDLARIMTQCRRLLGSRLNTMLVHGLPGDYQGKKSQPSKLPRDGSAVMVFSDVGLYQVDDVHRDAWAQWARRLQKTGTKPLLLAPVPRRLLTQDIAASFDAALLDDRQPLRLASRLQAAPKGNREASQKALDQFRAAVFGNPCVDGAFARRLRQLLARELKAPLDIGSEFEIRRAAGVQTIRTAFTLSASIRKKAARDFKALPISCQDALIGEHIEVLTALSPLLVGEYARWLLPVVPDSSRWKTRLGEAVKEAELLMQKAAIAIDRQLPDFCDSLLPHLDSQALFSAALFAGDESKMLQAAWALAFADRLDEVKPPPGLRLDELAWVFSDEGRGQTRGAISIRGIENADEKGQGVSILQFRQPEDVACALSVVAIGSVIERRSGLALHERFEVALIAAAKHVAGRISDAEELLGWVVTFLGGDNVIEMNDLAARLADQQEQFVLSKTLVAMRTENKDRSRVVYEARSWLRAKGFDLDSFTTALIDSLRFVNSSQVPTVITEITGVNPDDLIPLIDSIPHTLNLGPRKLTLDAIPKPSWAAAITRERDQLTATLPDGRTLIWFPRQEIRVETPDAGASQFIPPHGFWWDAAEHAECLGASGSLHKPQWASRHGVDEYGYWAEFTVKGITQRMRWIAPGEFWMGSPECEPQRSTEAPWIETLHRVILTRGQWLADTACTQALWQTVMGKNPSHFRADARCPVEQVTWEDVTGEFLGRLNRQVPGLAAALPSEAQWEYACRAGSETLFSFGDTIGSDQVNFDGTKPMPGSPQSECRQRTVPVQSLPANPWGLFEMHGNVWEWCADWLAEYPAGIVVDPAGPPEGLGRVLRGGSWIFFARRCRSAYRFAYYPGDRFNYIGFRLSRGLPAQGAEPGGPARSDGGGGAAELLSRKRRLG